MSSGFLPPSDYKTPPWPSLYWPVTDPLNHGYFIGSLVGLAIAAIYNAGAYRMSTWVPMLWGLIQALVVIMGSYSTVTTIL
ncbi:hypothetical protein KI688_000066 [Linnemannia hyalina]|uniref:Uncharacterized protein n=1 Tax=Linnemannia hyalina TaxID=64524 RepID=A0A9P8BZT5_9FUNG|nr:hypothetical protein KI688_000066 [Linnemannia hyalina]